MATQSFLGLFEIFVVVVITLVTILLWRRKPRNMPPGPRGWPIVGSLPSLSRNQPFVDLMKLGKKYGGRGDIVTLQLGSATVVVLNSYEAIKDALVKQGEYFSSRPDIPLFTDVQKRKGIAAGQYSREWKEQRTFAVKTLRNFGMGKKSMEGKISEEISFVFEELNQLKSRPSDIRNILTVSVSNIIFSIVRGERFEFDDPQFKLLLQNLDNVVANTGSASVLNFFPILKYIPFFNQKMKLLKNAVSTFQGYFLHLIDNHKQEFQENDVRDFIDAYLVETERTKSVPSSSFQDKEQLPIIIHNLFGAGSETTATSLYWTFLYMVVYPDVQKQVQQEIDRVVGRDRLPTLEDEPNLTFTKAVIMETQRLASIAPLAVPHYSDAKTKLFDYDIPKNTQVIINLWAVHHDPDTWDEPHSFKPSRFIDDSGNIIKPSEYIPFGIGRRECMGEQLATMELFLFTSFLLHRYSFKLPEGAPIPSLQGNIGITLSAETYKVILEER